MSNALQRQEVKEVVEIFTNSMIQAEKRKEDYKS